MTMTHKGTLYLHVCNLIAKQLYRFPLNITCSVVGSNVEYVQTTLTYFDYGNEVKSQNVFNISCLANVVGTDYEYFGQDDFRVRKPDIMFDVSIDDSLIYACSRKVTNERESIGTCNTPSHTY